MMHSSIFRRLQITVMLVCNTLLVLHLLCVGADKEYVSHGPHHPVHEQHYPDGRHNVEFDHEAVLGQCCF